MSEDFFTRNCPRCGHRIAVATEGQQLAFKLLCIDIDAQRDWPKNSGHHIGYKAWRQLFVAAWERIHDREAVVLPSVDGFDFDIIFRRADRLTTAELSEILPMVEAWMAENGVKRSRSGRERRSEQFGV